MRPFEFFRKDDIAKTIAQKNDKAKYIAGGTNLVDLMKKNIEQPDDIIDVNSVLPTEIVTEKKKLKIGAIAKNAAAAKNTAVLKDFPLISKAILAGASPQIRNMASCAGNILQRTRCPYFYDISTPCNKRKPGSGCSAKEGENRMNAVIGYSEDCVAVHPSDFCIALAALDATVLTRNSKNKKEEIHFKDFHRLPGNTPHLDNNLPQNSIIESIEIPQNNFAENNAYVKLRDRSSYAFALVSVAAALHLEGGKIKDSRLASGGVAHKPWRWYEAEKFLNGKIPTPENFSAAADLAVKDIKPLSKNGFKKEMLRGAIITALQNSLNP
ncbi:FAD-binding molybdopterin dehydrogenase [Chryseobacterium sp. Leaf404]|uniref:FAD binding domain-containing protein n=1 Tax=unclassified Chryseobacterium TaxID=2593645 RepID=UPI0006F602F2|nr:MULTISPECIES: xanthine dehydrogenase family protein subunit M [unclassified Chryseobacterium]KQT16917.1 FAD-binding molybdopterin dehydrogenase [Chryseobacterium sp. Leaf404]